MLKHTRHGLTDTCLCSNSAVSSRVSDFASVPTPPAVSAKRAPLPPPAPPVLPPLPPPGPPPAAWRALRFGRGAGASRCWVGAGWCRSSFCSSPSCWSFSASFSSRDAFSCAAWCAAWRACVHTTTLCSGSQVFKKQAPTLNWFERRWRRRQGVLRGRAG